MNSPKILFPFTDNVDLSKVKQISKYTQFGYLMNDHELIDTSLGNCGSFMLGFNRVDIVNRVAEHCKSMPFVSGEFMTTCDAVVELSNRLYNLTNGYRSFFSTSGSDAVEGALKVARLKHIAQGNENKKIILGIEQSYHGSTYLSSSISGGSFMTSYLGRGDMCYTISRSTDSSEQYNNIVQKIKELGSENISCIVIETCSWRAGIVIYSDEFWNNLRELCTIENIVLIIDDIAMCGGKTGKFLGFDIKPDVFTMGKALTGGYFPLSACMISEDIYSAVKEKFWSHGFTYSFSISGVYSTLTYLNILEEENIFDNYPMVLNNAKTYFDKLKSLGLVEEVKNYGLYFNLTLKNMPSDVNIEEEFFKNGLNVGIENYQWHWLQIVVPLTATDDYFNKLYTRLFTTLTKLQNASNLV